MPKTNIKITNSVFLIFVSLIFVFDIYLSISN